MSLNELPSSERIHIGIFGNRNAGKSTLINAITNQELSVVSDQAGTTTDPVKKAMEILPLGPVVVIDTPGFDDVGKLGELRVQKTKEIIRQCHIAVLVLDVDTMFFDIDSQPAINLKEVTTEKDIPLFIVINKTDLSSITMDKKQTAAALGVAEDRLFFVSAKEKSGIHELKEGLSGAIPKTKEKPLVADLIGPNQGLVMVIPIDESAPKGRIILPQQAVLREALDVGAQVYICQPDQYEDMMKNLSSNVSLVVTDSQAFDRVSQMTPNNIRLTSFSILLARKKGNLKLQVEGTEALEKLEDNDKILICEGCTHHRQCNDIGSVKLPAWIRRYTGKDLSFDFTSGGEYLEDLSDYKMVVHCGGCMLNDREMSHRIETANKQGIPITNYGVLIAYMNGILTHCTQIF